MHHPGSGPKWLLALCALVIGVLALLPAWGAAAAPTPPPAKAPPVDFDRDVRPILSENCFACHGFDAAKRQAGLRLDVPAGAAAKLPSGGIALVPGRPEASGLVQRVATHSMPPPASGKRLSEAQIALLRRWVEEGARYAQHWAFVPPQRPPLPPVRNQRWARNPIDRFVLARLEREGLRPAPEADRATLIRRVTLDLTGLPPTLAEVDAFLADRSPDAYEKVVDRLLASPHYGERMAQKWLDLARYADTHGFHIDSHRDMWPWRNWVIEAYNRNLPFDQFTIQQLAGDLLPNASLDQKVATGFNRNHPINFEGGAIPEEYAAAYIIDRIDTTATTWMGLTLRCGQCHDHKYDPLSQQEYYRFYAFFNNVPEQGLDGTKGNAVPFIKVPTPQQAEQLADYDRRIAALDGTLKARAGETAAARAAWESGPAGTATSAVTAGLVAHYRLDEGNGEAAADAAGKQAAGTFVGKPARSEGKVGGALRLDGGSALELGDAGAFDRSDRFSYGAWVYPDGAEAGAILSRLDEGAEFRGWDLFLNGGKVYAHLVHQWEQNAIRVNTRNPIESKKWTHLFVTYDGSGKAKGVRIYVDGRPAELNITHDRLSETIRTGRPLALGRRTTGAFFHGSIDEPRVYDRELAAAEVEQLAEFDGIRPALAVSPEQRSEEQQSAIRAYYLKHVDAASRQVAGDLAAVRKARADLDAAIPTSMVMEEMAKPRDTFILLRGQYDRKGEKVTAGTPACLPPMASELPHNRLGLARWLVDPTHPLTARVAVNRFWEMYFGMGLVRTAENFGTQGEQPSHPELLDWLAVEFMAPTTSSRSPWDIKAFQRLVVTSATYRQSSRATAALVARDPENRLLARGPRFRLPAEFVRDQALAVSGLLVPRIGGPSVKPYQPPGLWEELAFGGEFSAQKYEQDHGENLYRRSVYTFWKRTCPPPALQTFDAPEREFCIVRRSVTNTPLQALILMNDPTYVEAARKFAERLLTETPPAPLGRWWTPGPETVLAWAPSPATPRDRIAGAYRLALARPPRGAEADVLLDVYQRQLAAFRADPAAAEKLLGVGESKRNEQLDPAELAAWTSVATVILNLDEMITKG
jgi:mono/diheme cytochrome c family protein